jgi:hypothetical protein
MLIFRLLIIIVCGVLISLGNESLNLSFLALSLVYIIRTGKRTGNHPVNAIISRFKQEYQLTPNYPDHTNTGTI